MYVLHLISDSARLAEYQNLLMQSLGPAASMQHPYISQNKCILYNRISCHNNYVCVDSDLCSVAMEALLEATVAAPPTSIALELTKDINWIRVNITMCE